MIIYKPVTYLRQIYIKCLMLPLLFCLPALTSAQTVKAVFNHVALCSTDLKESTAFYTSVLQLKVIPHPFKDTLHTWYSIAPNIQMHIIQGSCPRVAHSIVEHICFSVPSVPDFISRLHQMKIVYSNWKGVPNQVERRVDGVSQVYFKDPDGYWIEVNDAK